VCPVKWLGKMRHFYKQDLANVGSTVLHSFGSNSWVSLNERGFVVACCLYLLHVFYVVLLALVCVMSVHTVVLLKYSNFLYVYSVCNIPIPCFRDVICSVKTIYKVETHVAKSVAACVQFYLSPRA